jgi:uncharacterized protein DUF5995
VPGTDATGIAPVIARMEEIDATLPRKDGVAYFNRLYLQVTKAVDASAAGTTFEDPAFLDRLDVVFAGLYFDAEATITTGAQAPLSWRPLIEMRADQREPIQFALAGMSAHINHDLAVAVVQTCTEMGLAPDDDSAVHRDYQRVDALLAAVETQVVGWFRQGLIADLEDITPPKLDNAIADWSIVVARDLAWEHAKLIWKLRHESILRDGYLDILARQTELAARAMLI